MNGTGCERKRTYPCYGGLLLQYLGGNEWRRPEETLSPAYCVASEVRKPVPPKHTTTFWAYIQKVKMLYAVKHEKQHPFAMGKEPVVTENWKLKGPMLTDLHDAVFSLSSHIAPHTHTHPSFFSHLVRADFNSTVECFRLTDWHAGNKTAAFSRVLKSSNVAARFGRAVSHCLTKSAFSY